MAMAVAVAVGAAAVLGTLWPPLRIASSAREVGVALAGVTSAVAILAAAATVGTLGRRRLDQLPIALAAVVLAVTVVAFGTVPAVVGADAGAVPRWGALAGTALGALLAAVGAIAPARAMTRTQVGAGVLLVGAWITVAVVAAALAASGPRAAAALAPAAIGGRRVSGEPAMMACAWTTAALFALAAAGLVRRAAAGSSPSAAAWAVAAALAALARAVDVAQPAPEATWVSSADLLRLASWGAILAAAGWHARTRRRAALVTAVREERRRMARDLHDVLAQELAVMARNITRLDPGDEVVRRLEAGATRALTEARAAITALSTPLDRPLDVDLAEAARHTAEREGAAVALDLATGVHVTPAQRDGFVRIAGEAITNAIRHGDAALVAVQLDASTGVRLRITDTGAGFEPGRARSGGFGLISMRERADAIGARFRLVTTPGHGTQVEVAIEHARDHRRHR
jgi:signal transduction histidine kinase